MLRIGLASHGPDKDFFKRGLDQFEAIDGCRGRGLLQQLLRVAVRLQPDLCMAGEVLCLGNLGALKKVRASLKLNNRRDCVRSAT